MCRVVQGATTAGTVSFCSSRSRIPLPTAWECPGQGGDAGGQAQLSRSCWASSLQWVTVSPAPLSPSALQEGQAEEPAPVLRPPAGGWWSGCSPVLSPSVRPRAGWIRQCLEGLGAAPPSRPTPTPPCPLRALRCVSPVASLSQVRVQTKGKVGAEQDTE